MRLKSIFILFLLVLARMGQAQPDLEKPKEDFATPYNSLHYYSYYMSPDHYQGQRFAKLFPKNTPNSSELALQLKQIFDGRGLRLQLAEIPADSFFLDTVLQKNNYAPFPRDLSEVYLELDKESKRWRFSPETVKAIPILHKKIYPLGTDLLVRFLPSFGDDKILGLHGWQYAGIFIVALFAFLLVWSISRLLRLLITYAADSKLGKNLVDKKIVLKIARVCSYLCMLYMLYILIPALQLPIELGYYVILVLRVLTTCFIVLLISRCIDLTKDYYIKLKEHELRPYLLLSDNLIPIVSRSVKVVVYLAGFFHILSILDVNVTALVAGLSIGGLAIALAAQETVKNLIGSAMIFADKPFKIGDYINNGSDIEGTVEDIGFRSTRIRNMDTSVVSVPNGKLIDMVVTNLGERQMRRFHTYINLPFNSPPQLLALFVEGLQKMVALHPHTHKEEIYAYINRVESHGVSVRFMIYFVTDEWKNELQYRQDIILGMMELAERLGLQIIPPASAVFIQQPAAFPPQEQAHASLDIFLSQFESKFPKPEPTDENGEEAIPSPS